MNFCSKSQKFETNQIFSSDPEPDVPKVGFADAVKQLPDENLDEFQYHTEHAKPLYEAQDHEAIAKLQDVHHLTLPENTGDEHHHLKSDHDVGSYS